MSLTIGGPDILQVIKVTAALFATYIVARVVSKILEKIFEKTPFPKQIANNIVRALKYVIYLMGFFVAISLIGIDLTSVVVGLGAFSIAISFATSNIIQNLVSGLLVIGDRAFMVGDHITIQGFSGRVAKIGIRTTVIEEADGDRVFIPNSLFINNPVVRKADKENHHGHEA